MKTNSMYENQTIENLVFELGEERINFNIISKLFAQYYISDSRWKNRITKAVKKILSMDDVQTTKIREIKRLLRQVELQEFQTTVTSAFPYPGGKNKMKNELNYVLSDLNESKQLDDGKFEIYADIFFGAGGSLNSMADQLEEIGVTKVIANELNKTIISTHKLIRDEPDKLINSFIELIRQKIVLPYGMYFLTQKEYIEVARDIARELKEKEEADDRGVETVIRFLLLQNIQYSGNYNPSEIFEVSDIKGDVYDLNKIIEISLNFPNRINKISNIYNKFDIEFTNVDAWDILQQYKHLDNILFNIDIIYTEEDKTPIDNFTSEQLESIKSEDIPLAKTNYGVKEFDTIKYIKELEVIDVIYNNNAHYVIEYYRRKFNLQKFNFTRVETSSAVEEGTRRKTVVEYIVYGNNKKNSKKTNA